MNTETIRKKVKQALESKKFLIIILTLVVIQGLWYALVYRPTILDEGRHIGMIEVYSNQWSPFITEQDPSNDILGDTTRDSSYLYYYTLSIPNRVINSFTNNEIVKTIFLRIIHIFVFVIGVYVYDKFFKKIGASVSLSRLALLLLVLTPAISVLPGAVNYDSFVFMFSGLLLLQASNILKSKKLYTREVLLFLFTILYGTLFKYTFLALAIPVGAYVVYRLIKDKKSLNFSLMKLSKINIALLVITIVGIGLFIERPVANFIKHSSFNADCIELHGKDRCANNYVQQRNITALERKNSNFEAKNLYEYTFDDWIPNMVYTQVRLNPWDAPSKVLHALYFGSLFAGLVLILVYLRETMKSKQLLLILLSIFSLSLVLLIDNYRLYAYLGEVVATSSRYLLPVQPLFMFMTILFAYRATKKFRKLQIIALVLVMSCFVFGGGVLTYKNTAPEQARWSYVGS